MYYVIHIYIQLLNIKLYIKIIHQYKNLFRYITIIIMIISYNKN